MGRIANNSLEDFIAEQKQFASEHPEYKDFIPTIMGVASTCQADVLGSRSPGPIESYAHIFDGTGENKKIRCAKCASKLNVQIEQRQQYL